MTQAGGVRQNLIALGLFVVVLAALLLWVGASGYRQDLVVLSASFALIALGIYIPFLLGGLLSVAYSAYALIGSYAVGILALYTDWPIPLAWIGGMIVAAVVAVLLGIATARLSGFHLVAVTLLFSTAFQTFLTDAESITGGSRGLLGFRALDFFGYPVSRQAQMIVAVVLVGVLGHLINRLASSPWGIVLQSSRAAPLAVESNGISVTALRLQALALGAAVASLGGALFATYNGGVSPETFSLQTVFVAAFMPLVGGVGSAWGGVIGAVLGIETTVNLPAVGDSGSFIFSLAVLVVLVLVPTGVLGALQWLLKAGAAAMGRRQMPIDKTPQEKLS